MWAFSRYSPVRDMGSVYGLVLGSPRSICNKVLILPSTYSFLSRHEGQSPSEIIMTHQTPSWRVSLETFLKSCATCATRARSKAALDNVQLNPHQWFMAVTSKVMFDSFQCSTKLMTSRAIPRLKKSLSLIYLFIIHYSIVTIFSVIIQQFQNFDPNFCN